MQDNTTLHREMLHFFSERSTSAGTTLFRPGKDDDDEAGPVTFSPWSQPELFNAPGATSKDMWAIEKVIPLYSNTDLNIVVQQKKY